MRISLSTERMQAEKDGSIGWVIFNHPERRNALSLDMWEAIPQILDVLENDPEIRVAVLRGAGDKAFISGADISQFEKNRSSSETRARYDEIAGRANLRLLGSPLPTVAMIQGFCIGGGLAMALNCDLRFAALDSRFAIPAARLGVGYHWAGLKRLMDVVGPAFAKEIFFTARQFSAEEALAMGLVNRVLPDTDLEPYVRDTCRRIGENAPLTLRAVKTVVAELTRDGGTFDRERCEQVVNDCFASEDYVEGRRAFMEKRRPAFRGR